MSALAESVRAALGERVLAVTAGFGPVTVDVTPDAWLEALTAARDAGATYADFLSGYDDGDAGIAVLAHLAGPDASDHLLLRTRVAREGGRLPSASGLMRGLAWHERETAEMLGVAFDGGDPRRLLLPPAVEGHPLRKEFALTERVRRPWPGAVEPAEAAGGRPRRRQLPPGVLESWLPRDPS